MLLGLVAMANRERELILRHFEERTVSSRLVEQLLADAGRLIDRARTGGQAEYIEAAQRVVGFSQRFRIAHFVHRRLSIDGPLVDALADRFESTLVNHIVLEELGPFIDDKLAALVGERAAQQLHEILRQRQEMTHTALEALRSQYPGYANLLERRFLDKVALRRQDEEYRGLFDSGVIGPELYGVLRREVQIGPRHSGRAAASRSGTGNSRADRPGAHVRESQRAATGLGRAPAQAALRSAWRTIDPPRRPRRRDVFSLLRRG